MADAPRSASSAASRAYRLAAALRPGALVALLRLAPRRLSAPERDEFRRNLEVAFGAAARERETLLEELRAIDEGLPDALVREADEIVAGNVHVFGHTVSFGAGAPDWHADALSGHHFPRLRPAWAVREAPYPGGYDVIVPWELSRFAFALRLAQAYVLTGDERYPSRLRGLILDWIRSNPVGYGVNWLCSMDVGLRAMSWVTALGLMTSSPSLDDRFWDAVRASLLAHGNHVSLNPTGVRPDGRNTNHLVACLTALVVLGAACRRDGVSEWYGEGFRGLRTEILSQVDEDGGQFEDSPCYHRLVLELALVALAAAEQLGGGSVSAEVRERLAAMLDYVAEYTRPDGSRPNFGDDDSGRVLVPFLEDSVGNLGSHLETLALGAVLLRRPDLLERAGASRVSAVWVAPEALAALRREAETPTGHDVPRKGLRRATGTAIATSGELHLVLKCGGNGQDGFGGHSHNDKLAVELCHSSGPLLVDSGTFCYTSDYVARARFRSTGAHNTVRVGDHEQNRFDVRHAFGYDADGPVRVLRWSEAGPVVTFSGEFAGYGDVPGAPAHLRFVAFDREAGVLAVEDEVAGTGAFGETCTASWHLAPRASAIELGGGALTAAFHGFGTLSLEWEPLEGARSVEARLEDAEYSDRYASVTPNRVLRVAWRPVGGRGGLRTIVGERCAAERALAALEALRAGLAPVDG